MTKRSSYRQVIFIFYLRIALAKIEEIVVKEVALMREGTDQDVIKIEEEIDLSLIQKVPLQVEDLQEAGHQAHQGHQADY